MNRNGTVLLAMIFVFGVFPAMGGSNQTGIVRDFSVSAAASPANTSLVAKSNAPESEEDASQQAQSSNSDEAIKLAQNPSMVSLRDLAELGPAGKAGGKILTERLVHASIYERLLYARTLGFIEYEDAIPQLIELFESSDDVVLHRIVAEALGLIGSELAVPALQDVASNHWYPVVRQKAQDSLIHIELGTTPTSPYHVNNFPFYYFDFEHMGLKTCSKVPLKSKPESKN